MSISPPLHPPPPGRLSADLARVLEAFAHRDVTLGEIIALMQQRAYNFVLLLIAVPFATPVPLPGLSTPFGLIIAFTGFRIACGMKPWLPARMMQTRLPAKWLPRMFRAASKLVRWLEKFLRPEFSWLVKPPVFRQIHGAMIMISGLLLLLPIPVPMTNFFPALAVVLLSCAMLESDGRFSIAGTIVFVIGCAYFALLGFGGTALITQAWEWLRGLF
jgi:Uncharacterized ABC-type transport system, permease components